MKWQLKKMNYIKDFKLYFYSLIRIYHPPMCKKTLKNRLKGHYYIVRFCDFKSVKTLAKRFLQSLRLKSIKDQIIV